MKLNLSKTVDADVLKVIVIKLQERVKTGLMTLLIKVKAHRADPLNEEADIKPEMGRIKEEKEKIWRVSTNRTIYQLSEVSETKTGTLITILREGEGREKLGEWMNFLHRGNENSLRRTAHS